MLDLLGGFIAELRTAGLPVSLGEHVDAARALESIDLGDRELFRASLRATLVKRGEHLEAFDRLFTLYFAPRVTAPEPEDKADISAATTTRAPAGGPSSGELRDDMLNAMMANDGAGLQASARQAVDRYAGIEKGRPVGAAYYLYRTLRHLDVDGLAAQLEAAFSPEDATPLEMHLAHDQAVEAIDELRDALEQEILSRLVDDRGLEAMAEATRRPLPEDVDVMQANREELANLEKALVPLGRKLAARLAQKRRKRRRGPVDVRRTIRESLSTGGVPLDIRFRPPHPVKPDIVVMADMSGSVASFARFTLLLVHALNDEFTRVRSFVFVDGVDEVSHLFEACEDPTEAADRIANEAKMIVADGHSDYGRVFEQFAERYAATLQPRSTLLILGDARNNYHLARSASFAAIAQRVKRVYWLNPEPEAYWRSGDSVLGEYAPYCDDVLECRTLRQLENFVMGLS